MWLLLMWLDSRKLINTSKYAIVGRKLHPTLRYERGIMKLAPAGLRQLFPGSHIVPVDQLRLGYGQVDTLAYAAFTKQIFIEEMEAACTKLEELRATSARGIETFARMSGVDHEDVFIGEVLRPTFVSLVEPHVGYVDETIEHLTWPVTLIVQGTELMVMMSIPSYLRGLLVANITVDRDFIHQSASIHRAAEEAEDYWWRFDDLVLDERNIEAWTTVFGGDYFSGVVSFVRLEGESWSYEASVHHD